MGKRGMKMRYVASSPFPCQAICNSCPNNTMGEAEARIIPQANALPTEKYVCGIKYIVVEGAVVKAVTLSAVVGAVATVADVKEMMATWRAGQLVMVSKVAIPVASIAVIVVVLIGVTIVLLIVKIIVGFIGVRGF
jgi:hypothetical protein